MIPEFVVSLVNENLDVPSFFHQQHDVTIRYNLLQIANPEAFAILRFIHEHISSKKPVRFVYFL